MKVSRVVSWWTRKLACTGLVLLAALSGWTGSASAQAPSVLEASGLSQLGLMGDKASGGGDILQTQCAACGSPVLDPPVIGPGACSGCSGKGCYPGRKPCDCDWEPSGRFEKFLHEMYTSTCCQDPCYEGCWVPLANSAFFLDQVRPATQIRTGADLGWDLKRPDKSELFWARVNVKGPSIPGNGLRPGPRPVDYQDLYFYMEGAKDRFGGFIQLSYRNVDAELYPSGSGFGDMIVGFKSLLFDSDLMQSTLVFKTFIPTGNVARGVGTGHVSLEPSLVSSVRITPDSYYQSQFGVRCTIGGDPEFQGTLFYYGGSYNCLLANCGTNIQLIGVLEGMIAQPLNGMYTDPITGLARRTRDLGPFFNAGPGVRLVLCKTIDFGVGSAFSITSDSHVGNLIRCEFRWRF